jgi:cytochrome c551/c552
MLKCIISILLLINLGCTSSNQQNSNNSKNVQKGQALFTNVGCSTCHSVSGEIRYGPSLNNILYKNVVVIREGQKIILKVDRNYLLKSIQQPSYEKVDGFQNKKMPEVNVSADDVELIIDYLTFINSK